ncbi:MAG: helix-turn-helix transcriptional regulator [Gammaproteobacteria bacterium]|nr:helix-turn-helix transcriptional regulator [Gammaproteobacteria bacterium]
MASPRSSRVDRKVAEAASIFAALGDETRLRIVTRLCRSGPQSIVRLTEGSRVTRQAVTKHLHALSEAGLVRGERVGRETVWELEPRRLAEVRRYLDIISAQWDEAIGRLRTFVESPPSKPS